MKTLSFVLLALAAMISVLTAACGQRGGALLYAAPSVTRTASPWPTITPRPPSPTPTTVPTAVLPDWAHSAPFDACSAALPDYVWASPDFKPRSCYISRRDPETSQVILTFEFQGEGYAAVSHGAWQELVETWVPPDVVPQLLSGGTAAPAVARFFDDGAVCLLGAVGGWVYRIDLRSGAEAPNGGEQFVSCDEDKSTAQAPPIPPVTQFERTDESWCTGIWGDRDPLRRFMAPVTSGATTYSIIDCREVSTGGRGTLWLFRLDGRLGVALIGFTDSFWLTDETGSTGGFDGVAGTLACWHDSGGRIFAVDLVDGALEEDPSECAAISWSAQ